MQYQLCQSFYPPVALRPLAKFKSIISYLIISFYFITLITI
ncbi:hypothetical protein HMPREF9078_00592 [Capnocytophaga sp. oral taxon 380 str. F0488]|nr:hypothetical protein HMPREF9078_00592 [Capnocytophaga sp. oral taxon 380 str. F0488]